MAAYDPSIAQLSYNVDAAKRLLSREGPPSGGPVTLLHNSALTLYAELGGAIQSYLRQIGMNVELLGKPTWSDFSAALQRREGHMFLYSWHIRAPYPERMLIPLFHSGSVGKTNFTRYSNRTVDKLLGDAVRMPEGPDRQRTYAQIQSLIVEDAPMVFLYHVTRMAVIRDRVQGFEANLLGVPADKLLRVDVAK